MNTFDPTDGSAEASIVGAPGTNYKLTQTDALDFASATDITLTGVTVGTQDGNEITTDGAGNATVQFNFGSGQRNFFHIKAP